MDACPSQHLAWGGSPLPTWLWTGILAAALALAHHFLAWQTGLLSHAPMPAGPELALMAAVALMYGWWGVSLHQAGRRERSALLGLASFQLLWVVLATAMGMAACPPPCGGAYPYLDGVRLGAIFFGLLAAHAAWGEYRRRRMVVRWGGPMVMILLLGPVLWLQAVLLFL